MNIKEIYKRLPILKEIGFEFEIEEISEEKIKISFNHKEIFERYGNFLFGGFIAMIFDAILGLLVRNSVNKDIVTISLTINFINKAKDEKYYLEGKIVRKGKNIIFAEGILFGKEGTLFSKAYGIWKIR
ncbi:MAG: PaaI family thioesterase [Candidatus Aenigmatarchaeota archaeon]